MPFIFPVPPKTDLSSADHMTVGDAHNDLLAFRDCHQRFQECLEYRDMQNKSAFSQLAEDYLLDFDLAAKRALGKNETRYRLFQLRYLQGGSQQECCKRLRLGAFHYASEITHVERLVGRALVKRGLFPLISYFSPEQQAKPQRIAA